MSQFVDRGEVSNQGADLIELNKELKTKIDELMDLLNDIKWEGSSKNIFSNTYKKTVSETYKMSDNIGKYGQFLSVVANSYDEVGSQATSSFEAYASSKASMSSTKSLASLSDVNITRRKTYGGGYGGLSDEELRRKKLLEQSASSSSSSGGVVLKGSSGNDKNVTILKK